jgi:hypothetical protein
VDGAHVPLLPFLLEFAPSLIAYQLGISLPQLDLPTHFEVVDGPRCRAVLAMRRRWRRRRTDQRIGPRAETTTTAGGRRWVGTAADPIAAALAAANSYDGVNPPSIVGAILGDHLIG